MADQVVWGVRVTEEFKERIAKVIEQSGLKAQDYLENLIDQYQLNRVKDNPLLQADVEELQMLTTRINSIYINVSERIQTYLEDKEIKQQEAIQKKDQDLNFTFNKIEELKVKCQELEKLKAELESSNAEYVMRITELEEKNDTNKALIVEYKEKNDTLTGLVNEYKEYKNANVLLLKGIEAEKEKNREAEALISSRDKEIEDLKVQIQGDQVKHERELASVMERAEFDKSRSLLEINIKHNEHVQEITEQHNKRVQELLAKLEARTEEHRRFTAKKKPSEADKSKIEK